MKLSHRKLTINIWSSSKVMVGDKYLKIRSIRIVFKATSIDATPWERSINREEA